LRVLLFHTRKICQQYWVGSCFGGYHELSK
jgi:hypothetical protein